jgi:hypothetical protein
MKNSELHNAYLETNFRVLLDQEKHIDITIDAYQPGLEINLKDLKTWAFITAHNPHPEVYDGAINTSRNSQLENDLKDLNLSYLEAEGISKDEQWKEESFFIINCSLHQAHRLSQKYGQLAFVFGKVEEKAQLIYTQHEI